ncbi:MAG TPA: MMPL family transporter [Oligoflexia bacterium]|nr:MMPL family transporter [Oligoflexia bacterium]
MSRFIFHLCSLVWFVVLGLALWFIVSTPISFSANILDLVISAEDNSSLLSRSRPVLDEGGRYFKIGIQGKSRSEVVKAGSELINDILELPGVKALEITTPEQSKEKLKSILSSSRVYLLTEEQINLILSDNAHNLIVDRIEALLGSSLSSFYSEFLTIDPLLLVPDRILDLPPMPEVEYEEGLFVDFKSDGNYFAYAFFKVDPYPLPLEMTKILVADIDYILSHMTASYENLDFHWSGFIKFTRSSAHRIQNDIGRVGFWGSLFVVGILLYSFGSLLPLITGMLVVGSGIIFGTFLTLLFLGEMNLLTLAFGSSLMGVSVDYSIHYQSEYYFIKRKSDIDSTIRSVFRPITLGALTSIIVFVSLFFSGFPGLRELSVFGIGSLFSAYLTVVLWFPLIFGEKVVDSKKVPSFLRMLVDAGKIKRNFGLTFKKKSKAKSFILFGIICFVVFSSINITTNDDIRLLQKPEPHILESELWLSERTGQRMPNSFVMIEGKTREDVEMRSVLASRLLRRLQGEGTIDSFASLYSFLPSRDDQERSYRVYREFLDKHEKELRESLLNRLEMDDRLVGRIFDMSDMSPLTEERVNKLVPEMLKSSLGIRAYDSGYFYQIPVFGVKDRGSLIKSLGEEYGIYFYEYHDELSKLFKSYRERALYLLLLAYVFIWLILVYLYGSKIGTKALVPALGSSVTTFSIMAIIGEPVNFFSILALVVVLGLGIDFVLFALEGKKEEGGSRETAAPVSILLSTCTTICTFSPLVLSDSPVLRTFGFVICLGVFFSYLYTRLLISLIATIRAKSLKYK